MGGVSCGDGRWLSFRDAKRISCVTNVSQSPLGIGKRRVREAKKRKSALPLNTVAIVQKRDIFNNNSERFTAPALVTPVLEKGGRYERLLGRLFL